jgi:hypothetical protein
MDTHSTLNIKIRKACIRIVVYVLMLMVLRAKTKICTMDKYKRSGSLTVTSHVPETLIKVISNSLGANMILNPKVGFKN